MMRRTPLTVALLAAALAAGPAPAAADVTVAPGLALVRVPNAATAFASPVQALSAPGSPDRLYVVERDGRVRLVEGGAVRPRPFLDFSAQVESTRSAPGGSENGLSSIAFAPDYAASGRLYAFFTDRTRCREGTVFCDDRLVELSRSPDDPDVAAPGMRTLLIVPRTGDFAIHRAGQLAFGSDGLLYVSTGDGGAPAVAARDPDALQGKVLRLDPSEAAPVPEVVAQGLRNPFRFSFDAVTDDLVLGDVGERRREEVDFLPVSATARADFGWPACEGELAFPDAGEDEPCGLAPAEHASPALTYPHDDGRCSVIGGFVVRDAALPALAGRYLYGDYCHGGVRSAVVGAGGASDDAATGLSVSWLSSFGQDASCRLYVTSMAGPVYRLDPTEAGAPASACPPPGPPRVRPARRPDPGPVPAAAVAGSPVSAPSPSAGSPRDLRAPRLGPLLLARRRVSAGHGTVARFALSEVASVALRVYRVRAGRPRFVLRALLTRRLGPGGRKSFFVPARPGGRPLAPGLYRVTLRARDAAGNTSAGRTATFVVARP